MKNYVVNYFKKGNKPPKRLNWADAMDWAESVNGVLPSRPVAALLYATAKNQFDPVWHWTSETLDADTGDKEGASSAWYCLFDGGYQNYNYVSSAGAARAVRLIEVTS